MVDVFDFQCGLSNGGGRADDSVVFQLTFLQQIGAVSTTVSLKASGVQLLSNLLGSAVRVLSVYETLFPVIERAVARGRNGTQLK